MKPIFGNKNRGNKTISLKEGNEVTTDDGKLSQTFNEYFVNFVPSLAITFFRENNDDINNENKDNTIKKFQDNPSIVAIKEQERLQNLMT